MVTNVTAGQIIDSLRNFHMPDGYAREWAFFAELRVGTGYAMHKHRTGSLASVEQRIDAWAINLYPSKKRERVAYEIKVSRSDFKREIERPEKRQAALLLSNRYYFAAPSGLISRTELPEECGLVEVLEDGRRIFVVQAPYREIDPPPISLLASIARRGANAESDNQKLRKELSGLYQSGRVSGYVPADDRVGM